MFICYLITIIIILHLATFPADLGKPTPVPGYPTGYPGTTNSNTCTSLYPGIAARNTTTTTTITSTNSDTVRTGSRVHAALLWGKLSPVWKRGSMSELFIEDDISEEDYVDAVISFIRECRGVTTKREIGKHIARPRWLLGPLGPELVRFGFDVTQNQVREGIAASIFWTRNERSRVRRRDEWEEEEVQVQPARKRRDVQGRANLRVSANISRIVTDTDAPFEYRLDPAVGEEQKRYQEALESDTPVIFVLGNAGTGKTLLAAQEALRRLQNSQVRRIILTRPAVEADDRMGFLPGSLDDKMAPFVAPALDAIDRQAGAGTARMLLNKDKIKIAALSHMRGSTMDDAFILADEMQNATFEQLRMLTTRHGKGTKLIICGDPQQSDRFSAGQDSPLTTVAEEVERTSDGRTFKTIRLHTVQRSAVAEQALELWARVDQKRRR
eukprot:1310342-Rhodomonas_salina.1